MMKRPTTIKPTIRPIVTKPIVTRAISVSLINPLTAVIASCTLLLMPVSVGLGQTVPAATQASLPASASAFDLLKQTYGAYVDETDPLGWPMKVRSVTADEFKFWRGTKDLFFNWCKTHCDDWMHDPSAFVPSHGDLHPGNIGTYQSGNVSTLAFGPIDFDDSAMLPFQFEVLAGQITFELIAQVQKIDLSNEQREQLAARIVGTYFDALKDDRTAQEILGKDKEISKMLGEFEMNKYEKELEGLTQDGRFRAVVLTKKGEVREVLTPIDERKSDIAGALAQAMVDAPELGALVKYKTADEFAKAIKSIALRTRIGSSGSQGLEKIFVLIEKPIAAFDFDVIFYLKQQLPPAAVRAGLIERAIVGSDASPGKKTFLLMKEMNQPVPLFSGFADIEGKSYFLSIKEPWTDALEFDSAKDFDSLLQDAKRWAVVAARSNGRSNGQLTSTSDRLEKFNTPEFERQVLDRAKAYLAHANADFRAFLADPRTAAAIAKTETFLNGLKK